MSDLLDRFFRVLVQEIRKNRPEYLESPFTVAEIYQNLVPYRTHRDAIGVEMNGDYEDTLLRLLGGEGDYLMLDSEVARREIREELQSTNPNTGLFRDFAAADVRLTSAHTSVADDGDSVDPGPPDTPVEAGEDVGEDVEAEEQPRLFVVGYHDTIEEVGDDDVEPVASMEASHEAEPTDATEIAELAPDAFDDPDDGDEDDHEVASVEVASGGEDSENGACHWCRQELPDRKILNFCPYCGSDLRLTPCGACGEELEPGWRFCPACGTETES